jgi:N4-gp56 family major capsid protein
MAYPDLVSAGSTNFGNLTDEQKTTWGRDLWRQTKENSFMDAFTGSGINSMIQKVPYLTKSEKGTRAVISLLAELDTDGIAGDSQLEGNEEAMKSYEMVIQIDQLRNANRIAGRMADQKSIINFRENSRDVLAYWLADRMDQLAFLTMSGVLYTKKNDGTARAANGLSDLDFAADVTAPTRAFAWTGDSTGLADSTFTTSNSHTLDVAGDGFASYAMIVELRAKARDLAIRGVKGEQGNELYHMFVTPQVMKKLKLDADFLANVRNAGVRGGSNPLFAGSASYLVDGVMIHEFRHTYHTSIVASGDTNPTKQARALFCGAQAMAFADIGAPNWVEDNYDYQNQSGISVSKIFGMKKSVFKQGPTASNGTPADLLLDHGLMTVDLTEVAGS